MSTEATMGELFDSQGATPTDPPATPPATSPAGDPPTPPVVPPVTPPAGDPPTDPPPTQDPPAGDPPSGDPPANEEEDEGSLWDEVNTLRGRAVQFELPESVEPDTPEAIIHFEKAVRGEERAAVINELKESDPRLYAYMLHRKNGGSDEEFFGERTATVLPDVNELVQSVDLQKSLYKRSLIEKGVDEDAAQAVVEKAVLDKTITDKSKAVYDRMKADEVKLATDMENQTQQITDSNKKLGATLITESTKLVTENSLSFRVPEEEKGAFLDFFKDNVVIDNGKAFIAMELDGQNLNTKQALEQIYLLYKKGDLSKVIGSVAKTTQARRFKTAAAKAGVVPQSNNPTPAKSGGDTIMDVFNHALQ